MMGTRTFIFGYVFGFDLCALVYGKNTGDVGLLPNIRFQLMGYYFSPHHWMYFLMLVFVTAFLHHKYGFLTENVFRLVLGICVGGFVQGLTYKDWFIVATRL